MKFYTHTQIKFYRFISRHLSILILILVILTGCINDDGFERDESRNTRIIKAKEWFETNKYQTGKSVKNARTKEIEKLPHWESHIIHELEDGRELIEVYLDQDSKLLLKVGENADLNEEAFNTLLLFENDSSGYDIFVSRLYSDNKGQQYSFDDINRYNFLSVPEDFSGRKTIFDWNDISLGGWIYKDGKMSKSVKRTKIAPSKIANARVSSMIYYSCNYEYETWIIESGGEIQDVELYFMMECEIWEQPESAPDNPFSGGGSPGPGGDGPNPPEEEEHCYEPHPTVPNLYVMCGYMSIFESLNQIVLNKPFALLSDVPCAVVQAWLGTATFEVKQPELSKLNTIVANHSGSAGTGSPGFTNQTIARIQSINNAYSTVVNMDYFPVTVSQLPTVNGQQMTPEAFLHHIRTNINAFVDNYEAIFTPYNHFGVNDEGLWNSSNPTGAVVSIDIWGPDNGSVITSYSSQDQWTFTTIYDPLNWEHPVSGNRDFGYVQNTNGSYTFYTRGVDRLTNGLGTAAQWISSQSGTTTLSPFAHADALWESFQSKISSYVNQNGGSATVVPAQKNRPKWQDLADVIDGVKPLSTLSSDCDD